MTVQDAPSGPALPDAGAALRVAPGGAGEVRLSGEIDLVTAPILRQALEDAAAGKPRRVVVDLSEVLYLDSTGIAVLYKLTETTDLCLRVRPNSAVAKVIGICGLHHAAAVELVPAPGRGD